MIAGRCVRRTGNPAFTEATYRSLLDLVAETKKVNESLSPKDNIDVQSFIWIVGVYDENSVVEPIG